MFARAQRRSKTGEFNSTTQELNSVVDETGKNEKYDNQTHGTLYDRASLHPIQPFPPAEETRIPF
jgi:hypothetical protein